MKYAYEKKTMSYGNFTTNNSSDLFINYLDENNIKISKKSKFNFYTCQYNLDNTCIEFILENIEVLWKTKKKVAFTKHYKGKAIKLELVKVNKNCYMNFYINDNIILKHLDITDSRRLYAMLKELYLYGITNKLEY